MNKPAIKQLPTLKAITLVKEGDLQYRVYELLIQGDKVISKRAVDRGAGDLPQIQIARAETAMWSYNEQTKDLVEKFKNT